MKDTSLSIIRIVIIFSPPPTCLQRQHTRQSDTADKVGRCKLKRGPF